MTFYEQLQKWAREGDGKIFGVPADKLYARAVVAIGVLLLVGSLISLAKSIVGAF